MSSMPRRRSSSFASGEVSSDNSCWRELRAVGYALVEVGVVVAGMADELPGAVGNAFDDGGEEFEVEHAGDENAERAVGGAQAVGFDFAPEASGKFSWRWWVRCRSFAE